MASIQPKRNKFYVVYYIPDPQSGKPKNRKPVWEPFNTYEAAEKYREKIEFMEKNGGRVPVANIRTLADMIDYFVLEYGVYKWGITTFSSNRGLINNYIIPYAGHWNIEEVSTMTIERFYNELLRTPAVCHKYHKKPKNEFVSPSTIRDIHKILSAAFKKAKKWKIVSENPCVDADRPKVEPTTRAQWTVEQIKTAVENSRHDFLIHMAIQMQFCCSTRSGELGGLEWKRVDISDEAIAMDNATVEFTQQLTRVNRNDLEKIQRTGDIYFRFPVQKPNSTTALVLKKLKTESSNRKVWIPRTLALRLRQYREWQNESKEIMGEDYKDYDLVFAHDNGFPFEQQHFLRRLKKVARDSNLPEIVFHSIRGSSSTYKLLWSGGDIKSVQGDTGHAQAGVLMDTYATAVSDQRRRNATQIMEREFYGSTTDQPGELEQVISLLVQNPDIVSQLKGMLMKT